MKYLKHLFTAMLLLCTTFATAHDFEVNGIYYNITYETNRTVEVTCKGTSSTQYSDEYTGSVVIPSSVTYNGTIYSVTSIGESAFRDCDGLESVTIPNSVTSIGYGAFSYCDSLTSVTIPNSVTSIEDYAFYYCSGLTSVAIPNSVTSIGISAFCGCSGLESITISNSVTSIGDYAFSYCYSLTSVTIPNSVTSIGDYAFYHCYSLTSVTIGNGVTSIGSYAFYECYGLTSVTIPNSVTSIGSGAFYNCSGLKEIYVKAKTPPTINSNVFYSVPTASATLYVPIGTKAAYQVADGWKDFGNIVEMDFGIKGDINGDDTVSVTDIQSVVNLILSAASAEDNPVADVNSDGTISVTDIQSVVNIILNVE